MIVKLCWMLLITAAFFPLDASDEELCSYCEDMLMLKPTRSIPEFSQQKTLLALHSMIGELKERQQSLQCAIDELADPVAHQNVNKCSAIELILSTADEHVLKKNCYRLICSDGENRLYLDNDIMNAFGLIMEWPAEKTRDIYITNHSHKELENFITICRRFFSNCIVTDTDIAARTDWALINSVELAGCLPLITNNALWNIYTMAILLQSPELEYAAAQKIANFYEEFKTSTNDTLDEFLHESKSSPLTKNIKRLNAQNNAILLTAARSFAKKLRLKSTEAEIRKLNVYETITTYADIPTSLILIYSLAFTQKNPSWYFVDRGHIKKWFKDLHIEIKEKIIKKFLTTAFQEYLKTT